MFQHSQSWPLEPYRCIRPILQKPSRDGFGTKEGRLNPGSNGEEMLQVDNHASFFWLERKKIFCKPGVTSEYANPPLLTLVEGVEGLESGK